MKTPRTSSQASGRPRSTAASPHLQIAYQLDALLHTMRVLARSEEQLCSLMHSIERERTLPAHARRELLHLLQDLPTDTCDADRHVLLDALGAASSPRRSTPRKAASRRAPTPSARKPAKGKVPARKAAAPARSKATSRRAPATRRTTSAGRTATPSTAAAARKPSHARATPRKRS